ncbi:Bud-site selection protein [Clohesyomyces aquaticus]|uniref:Bud-site selection protein n=1 Tax=Clohesyomyces aquaticus TaxID=1231657 RepID=A0A1Y1ZL30_9PLEO|nr:Bud-site selection protein [Clohesyomyces aquaticus]
MPKRKRSDGSPSAPALGSSSSRLLSRQKKLCNHRLDTAQKALVSALRLGAGFERQKYSRRRKTAKEKNDQKAVARLEAEYTVLKVLDFAKVAEQHLRRTVQRVKSIKGNEALPEKLREGDKEKEVREQAMLNVCARLCKVQAVRKIVDDMINDFKQILGVEAGGAPKPQIDVHKEKSDPQQHKEREEREEVEKEDASVGGLSDDDGEAFAAFDFRIAAPSSAEDGSDSGSISDGHRPPSLADTEDESSDNGSVASIPSQADAIDEESSEAISSADKNSSGDSDSDSGIPIPAPKAKSRGKDQEKPTKSTFLPSLSMGNYLSGSDSEASDLDVDVAPKKNRRGQRARQQIWEKKFGEKAKHVQKQDSQTGWDPKKGAVDTRGKFGGRGKDGIRPGTRGPQMSGENALPLGPKKAKKRDDVGELHPSWLAAKAAKEQKVNVKPMGKKLVFD